MFLGSAEREFGECILGVSIPGHGKDYVHILAASNFNVKLNVSQLDTALQNIVKKAYHLAESSLTSCMLSAAFFTSLGMIPFGNIFNFLKPGQAIPVEQLQGRAERADVNNSLYCPPSDDEMFQSFC